MNEFRWSLRLSQKDGDELIINDELAKSIR